MVVSFPFTGSLTPLVFISWIPLLLTEHAVSAGRLRSYKVFIHSYITFFIYNFGTTWWIWNADEVGAILAFVCNSLLMALAFQVFHFCKKHIGRKEGYIGLLLIWTAFEFCHFRWELSWPWLSLGNTFSIRPSWIQWYEITGVLGGTIWILIINLLLFRIAENVFFKKETWNIQTPLFIVVSLFLIIPLSSSVYKYINFKEKGKKIEVVITQPNIDPFNEKFDSSNPDAQLHKMITLANNVITPNTAIVLAPETAIPFPFNESIFSDIPPYQVLDQALKSWKTTDLLIGASTMKFFNQKNSRAAKPSPYENGGFIEYYNTSILMKSGQSDFLHKSKLVLAAEIVPFSNWFPALENLSLNLGGTGTGTLGIEKEPSNFTTNEFTFAPVICYESIYGDFVAEQCKKGAEAIFIITNDGWWGDTPGYKQHASFAQIRAIENRKYVARSANTGKSCVINQRGDMIQETEWWKATAIRSDIYLNKDKTFYSIQGDGLGRVFAFVSLLLILLAIVRKIKPTKFKN